MDNIYIGLKLDEAIMLAETNKLSYHIKLVSSDKVKKSDTKIIVKTETLDDNTILLYVGEFLYNIEV